MMSGHGVNLIAPFPYDYGSSSQINCYARITCTNRSGVKLDLGLDHWSCLTEPSSQPFNWFSAFPLVMLSPNCYDVTITILFNTIKEDNWAATLNPNLPEV